MSIGVRIASAVTSVLLVVPAGVSALRGPILPLERPSVSALARVAPQDPSQVPGDIAVGVERRAIPT